MGTRLAAHPTRNATGTSPPLRLMTSEQQLNSHHRTRCSIVRSRAKVTSPPAAIASSTRRTSGSGSPRATISSISRLGDTMGGRGRGGGG